MSWLSQVVLYSTITALCTWLGALPFALYRNKRISHTTLWIMNAIAASMMIAASFWLIYQALSSRDMISSRSELLVSEYYFWIPYTVIWVSLWVISWLFFILFAEKKLKKYENLSIDQLKGADARKAILIVWIMTLHSFSEWVAIWVAFWPSESFWVFIAVALAIHNIPEGLAISSVMVPRGTPRWKAWLWSVFSSLPQPLMAIPAFFFVYRFAPFLPIWLWFAAWAMLWMSFSELLPEAIHEAKSETVATCITIGILCMIVFQTLLSGW